MIFINMDKAREIHKDKIRWARGPLLKKLDIEFQKALETNEDTTDIINRKIVLRDATENPLIQSASNIEELKWSWDVELLGPSPYSQV